MTDIKIFNFNFVSMTTPCEVILYDKDPIKAANCFEAIKQSTYELEKKYNFYDKKSYLNKTINNRKRNKVSIDKQTFSILQRVRDISLKTENIFDISIGTIKKCYTLSSLKEIKECKNSLESKMGIDSWNLKEGKLHFKYKETKFDLGGVIKEYSVDLAAKIAKEYEIQSALINFGGDIYALGLKPNNEPFSIGIKNPHNPTENLLLVNISNQALTTSASYERSTKIEGEELSHILSKDLLQTNILSSTVISNSALESGIFSTSFMINPSCEITDDLKVVLIDEKLNIHQNLA